MKKTRELLSASIVSKRAPGPSIMTEVWTARAPVVKLIVCGTENTAESKAIVDPKAPGVQLELRGVLPIATASNALRKEHTVELPGSRLVLTTTTGGGGKIRVMVTFLDV